ncbi:kinase-like protein [Rhizopogon salebrosus TDB-379]|nr:kinase-like protein [Rhizopogon salebrosus TDB-379]
MSNGNIRSEIELLSSLPHHDNVVPLLGFTHNEASLSLVMPWMSDGTLTSFVRIHGEALDTVAKSTLVHDISSGLQHLHSNFVVHGNIESDNVLINEQHRACLSGFRQSVKLSSREAECPQSKMPRNPEVQFAGPEWFVRNDRRFQLSQSLFKSDVYSLGCVIFYIFTKCMPWYDATSTDISDKLRRCVTPSRPKGAVIDGGQWGLIEPCLSFLPQNRPSMSHLLKDIKEYIVSVGLRDLSGQIKVPNFARDRGGYGSVYEGIWTRKTGGEVKVAVKILHIRDRSPEGLAKVEKDLRKELAAWRRLSHPNILSLLGTTTGQCPGGTKAMVSLWMENGSLDRYMKARNGVLTPSQRHLWAKDVAQGLKYLHEHPIVHGDLTPFNVLINNEGRAVLTDFGLSIILGGFTNVSCIYTDGKTGMVAWAAPELFIDDASLTKDVESPQASTKSDVYSFACLMYLNDILTSIISCSTPGSHVSGTYTEVHQYELTDSAKLVAIKSYKPMFNNSKKVRSEIELLSGLPHHDNVVPLLGSEDDGVSISLIMPWMSGGTLTSFIGTRGEVLETAAKSTLVHDISSGLHHLHSNFIVHGNLESDNILINEQHRACVSGFRQSVKLSSRVAECPRSQMPPRPAIQFAGPEWFVKNDARFQPLPQSLFKSDIYSIGCVMFYVFTNCMPWYDETSMDISDKLRQCMTPSRPKDSMVDDQWTLIEPCLHLLPQKRPSTSDLLKIIKGYLVSVGPCDLSG